MIKNSQKPFKNQKNLWKPETLGVHFKTVLELGGFESGDCDARSPRAMGCSGAPIECVSVMDCGDGITAFDSDLETVCEASDFPSASANRH